MKNDGLTEIMTDIDDRFIEEAVPKRFKKGYFPVKRFLSAACLLIAAGISAVLLAGAPRLKAPVINAQLEKEYMSIADAGFLRPAAPDPDEPGTSVTIMDYSVIEYNSGHYIKKASGIPESDIGGFICEVISEPDVELDPSGEIKTRIYRVSGISDRCAVAAKSPAESVYSLYINTAYMPETLGALSEELSFGESADFGRIYCFSKNGSGESVTAVYDGDYSEKLLKEVLGKQRKRIEPSAFPTEGILMTVLYGIPALGRENARISIADDGYVYIDILGSCGRFKPGNAALSRFMKYVTVNCEGHEIIFVQESENNK